MAVRPSPDRSDLESKTREDLQTIAKGKGRRRVGASFQGLTHRSDHGRPRTRFDQRTRTGDASGAFTSHGRHPDDDFDDLLGEFVADAAVASSETASATESTTEDAPAPAPSANAPIALSRIPVRTHSPPGPPTA